MIQKISLQKRKKNYCHRLFEESTDNSLERPARLCLLLKSSSSFPLSLVSSFSVSILQKNMIFPMIYGIFCKNTFCQIFENRWVYLGDFLISAVFISEVNGDRGGGEEMDVGDKVLPSRAWSITGLYPMCIKLAMCRKSNNQAVST